MTLFPGDSLNIAKSNLKDANGRYIVAFESGQTFTPKFWDQHFIPWKYRYLLVPFVARKTKFISGPIELAVPTLDGLDFPTWLPQPLNSLRKSWKVIPFGGTYFETQIWREIKPTDLEGIEYAGGLAFDNLLDNRDPQEWLKSGRFVRDIRNKPQIYR